MGGEFYNNDKGDKKRIYDLFDILQKQYSEQLSINKPKAIITENND